VGPASAARAGIEAELDGLDFDADPEDVDAEPDADASFDCDS
jgi:hypothetical protein